MYDLNSSTWSSVQTFAASISHENMGWIIAILFFLFVMFLIPLVYIINSIFLAKIFKKAGVSGWKAWVPLYNYYVILQLGGQPGWIAFLLLGSSIGAAITGVDDTTTAATILGGLFSLPSIIASVYIIIATYHIGKKLGKSDAFVLLSILLSIVWVIILGAGSSRWNESAGKPRTDKEPPQPPQVPPVATPAI